MVSEHQVRSSKSREKRKRKRKKRKEREVKNFGEQIIETKKIVIVRDET